MLIFNSCRELFYTLVIHSLSCKSGKHYCIFYRIKKKYAAFSHCILEALTLPKIVLTNFIQDISSTHFFQSAYPTPSDPPSNVPWFFNRLRHYISSVLTYLLKYHSLWTLNMLHASIPNPHTWYLYELLDHCCFSIICELFACRHCFKSICIHAVCILLNVLLHLTAVGCSFNELWKQKLISNFNYCLQKNISTKIALQWHHWHVKLILIDVKIIANQLN